MVSQSLGRSVASMLTNRSLRVAATRLSNPSPLRSFSALPEPQSPHNANNTPTGDLFSSNSELRAGQWARVQRVFGPRDTAQVMLLVGGDSLAQNASFDPNYDRAQSWIRHHAVGPAILTPVLLSGLVGALVEAAFPRAVVLQQELGHLRPVVVGVPVQAEIEIVEAIPSDGQPLKDHALRGAGHSVLLRTQVARLRDNAVIAEGKHYIWVPDYNNV